MTQQEFNTKHHKTIQHIRQTLRAWEKKDKDFQSKPHWLPYFCKMMVVLEVVPKMEVKNVSEALRDAVESNLIPNPGLKWEGQMLFCKDISVPFEVFLEARFGEDRPDEETPSPIETTRQVLSAVTDLAQRVEKLFDEVRQLIDVLDRDESRRTYNPIPQSLMESLNL